MEQLMVFSDANVYVLSKLVALVRRVSGHRHRLSNNEAIICLLQEASQSPNERVQHYYGRFLDNLSSEQRKRFQAIGLSVNNTITPDTDMQAKVAV